MAYTDPLAYLRGINSSAGDGRNFNETWLNGFKGLVGTKLFDLDSTLWSGAPRASTTGDDGPTLESQIAAERQVAALNAAGLRGGSNSLAQDPTATGRLSLGGQDFTLGWTGNGWTLSQLGDNGVAGRQLQIGLSADGTLQDVQLAYSPGWDRMDTLGVLSVLGAAAGGVAAGGGTTASTASTASTAAGGTTAGGAAAAGGAAEAGALGSGTFGLEASAGSSFGSLTGSTALTGTTAGGVAGSSGLTLAEVAAGTTATSTAGGGLLAGVQEAVSAVGPYYQAASTAASLYGQTQGARANQQRADALSNQVQNAQNVTNNLQTPTAPPVPAAQAATEQAYRGQDAYDAITTVLRRANARRGRGETDLTGGSLDFSSTRQAANTLLGS